MADDAIQKQRNSTINRKRKMWIDSGREITVGRKLVTGENISGIQMALLSPRALFPVVSH